MSSAIYGSASRQAEKLRKEKANLIKEQENVAKQAAHAIKSMGEKFSASVGSQIAEDNKTYGYMTLDEFVVAEKETKKATLLAVHANAKDKAPKAVKAAKTKKKRALKKATLSFSMDDDDDDDIAPPIKRKKVGKDPKLDSSFILDEERERKEKEAREQLKREWVEKQDKLKKSILNIVFSYWDGRGHRAKMKVTQETTIGEFLEKARKQLSKKYPELLCVSRKDLMFVKEDLIVPHQFSFYELILSKARGKTGPLFEFEPNNVIRSEKDKTNINHKSHVVRIVVQMWYDRNKRIYPASLWEEFNPSKVYDAQAQYDSDDE
eukprot:TRINITY_DN774044_c0_g1_i1.p1 TRINITY_DN774044_c0_g1~~TRINITY_DN774044_c0_g1_i1.p1  ORF type:complete len:321 (-),score=112.13 TRINITY_DN774044_c0_g1_i1:198-1160(-)